MRVQKRRRGGIVLLGIVLLGGFLFCWEAQATRMPGGLDYLLLAVLLFGSIFGIVAQIVFAIVLLRRLGETSSTPGRKLPFFALGLSVFLGLLSLFAFAFPRGKSCASGSCQVLPATSPSATMDSSSLTIFPGAETFTSCESATGPPCKSSKSP